MIRAVKKLRFKKKLPLQDPQEFLRDMDMSESLLLSLFYELAKVTYIQQALDTAVSFVLKIFEVDGAAVFLTDADGKYLFPKAFKVRRKLFKKPLVKRFLSEKIPTVSNFATAQAFRTGKVFVSQGNIIRTVRDAGLKSVFAFPILVQGRVIGVLSLGRVEKKELTVRQMGIAELLGIYLGVKIDFLNANKKVQEQKNMMEVLQNSVSEGLSLHGSDGTIFYANRAVGKLLSTTESTIGLKRTELIENWDRYHKYSMERLYDTKKMLKTVYQEKKPFLGALMKISSKPVRYIEADYFPISHLGKFQGMAATYRDVTQIRFQEQELARKIEELTLEKERWDAIYESVDEGVCIIDRESRIVSMNPACEQLNAIAFKEAKGKPYYQIFQCHTKAGLYYPDFSPLEKLFITKEAIPYEEHLHINGNGEEFWVGVSSSPLFNKAGEVEQVVLITRDMSSFKELEKAKSEFVSIASHELRTPLTVINGYLSLLLNGDLGDFSDETSRRTLKKVLLKAANETERLTRLVKDLLDVSRIEEKRMVLEKRPTPIKDLVSEVVDEVRQIAHQKNLNLFYESASGDDETLVVVCDRPKIFQALLNLIDNSVKFTPEGGLIKVCYGRQGEKVLISVEDNGIGIPRKLQSVIFEKFQQVPGSYLKENRGTGLGLFIVKSLIELHQGTLELESDIGKGTKFTFTLPINIA